MSALYGPSWRFWRKVKGGDVTTCWIWQASLHRGYGQFAVSSRQIVIAHRFAYEELVGPIPDGLHLDHLCRQPKCVNPWHLEPVTPLVNVRRGSRCNPGLEPQRVA